MRSKGPGVFFLKIFFGCFLVASCGQEPERTDAHAITRFLPATQARIIDLSTSRNSQILDPGTLKLIHEITAPGLVQKCLSVFQKPAFTAQYICDNLSGEIIDGTVCLRFYCPDRDFSVIFLDSLLHRFQAQKNMGIRDSMGLKLKEIEQQLVLAKNVMEQQNDSIIRFKEQFNLPASAEEMNLVLSSGTYALDSAVSADFFQLQLTFQKCLEHCARLTLEKDNLRSQLYAMSFRLYMVEDPHYVQDKK